MQSWSPSLLTRLGGGGGWVVGKLESNAKLNKKLRLKLKVKFELSLAIIQQKFHRTGLNMVQLISCCSSNWLAELASFAFNLTSPTFLHKPKCLYLSWDSFHLFHLLFSVIYVSLGPAAPIKNLYCESCRRHLITLKKRPQYVNLKL